MGKELSIGEKFHSKTSMSWKGVPGDQFRTRPKTPPQFKTYKDSKLIKLPKPEYQGITLEATIKKRQGNKVDKEQPFNRGNFIGFISSG